MCFEMFEERFICDFDKGNVCGESIESAHGGQLKCSPRWNLDGDDGAICIKITPICAFDDPRKASQLHVICPLFRLMAVVERAKGNDLSSLDACIGSPVVLFEDSVIEDLTSLGRDVQESVCTSLIFASNWFRVILTCFLGDSDEDICAKLKHRVKHLCHVESLLRKACQAVPSFVPPHSRNANRSSVALAASAQSARQGDVDCAAEEVPSESKVASGKGKGKAKKASKGPGDGSDAFAMCKKSFISIPPLVAGVLCRTKSSMSDDSSTPHHRLKDFALQPREVAFILEHINHCLRTGLKAKTTSWRAAFQNKPSFSLDVECCVHSKKTPLELVQLFCGDSNGSTADSTAFSTMKNCLDAIMASLADDDEKPDDTCSDDENTEQAGLVQDLSSDTFRSCSFPDTVSILETILKNLMEVVSSQMHIVEPAIGALRHRSSSGSAQIPDGAPGAEEHSVLLRVLGMFSNATTGSEFTLQQLCKHSFDYFSEMLLKLIVERERPCVLQTITVFMKTLRGIADLEWRAANPHIDPCSGAARDGEQRVEGGLRARLSGMAGSMMEKDWSGGDTKFKYNKGNLGLLVKLYLEFAESPLDIVEYITTDLMQQLVNSEKQRGPLDSHPTLKKQSFVHYFSPCIETLSNLFAAIDFPSVSHGNLGEADAVRDDVVLFKVHKSVFCLEALITLTRVYEGRQVLSATLRHGLSFVETFIKEAFGFLETRFRKHQQKITKIFKTFQKCTRQMHYVCDHGKVVKDNSMVALVPKLRR